MWTLAAYRSAQGFADDDHLLNLIGNRFAYESTPDEGGVQGAIALYTLESILQAN